MSRFATVDYTLDGIEFAPWVRCDDCSGGPAPGARALLAYWLESFEGIATSLGIYNCRPVRGGSSLSIHACGRAVDGGVPVTVAGHRVAMEFWNRMAPHAKDLGVQLLIFSRTSGSARNPWPTRYNGVHPHDDHWHGELTPNAGANLTLATLRARVGDFRTDVPEPEPTPEPIPEPTPEPTPTPPSNWQQEVIASMDQINFSEVRAGQRSTFVTSPKAGVKRVQSLLAASGFPPQRSFDTRGRPDGVGGPNTLSSVRTFQQRNGLTVDGIVGPQTYRALLGA
jgi:hypothetical protein